MSIDERLANSQFPLPAIREVNLLKHASGISLGLGELKDFPVDDQIFEALATNWKNGGTSYTQNAGLPQLRQAVADLQSKEDGFAYTLEHVVITIGVQNAIYTTIKTLCNLGAKRVLIPQIHFGIYKKIPLEFGMEVVTYPLNDDFSIDLGQLSQLINADDILLLNSPSNPTGRVLTETELVDLASLLNQTLTDGYVISDEIYGRLVYDGIRPRSFSAFFKRTIVVDGISKSAAAAGLRVGWVITSNSVLAKAITSANASIISTPPTANQFAALPVVLGQTQNTIDGYNALLKANRDNVMGVLERLNIPFVKPCGSFYIFPQMQGILGGETKSFCLDTAKRENGVVVIPGVAFGASSYIRISLASLHIEEGMRRFEQMLLSYKRE